MGVLPDSNLVEHLTEQLVSDLESVMSRTIPDDKSKAIRAVLAEGVKEALNTAESQAHLLCSAAIEAVKIEFSKHHCPHCQDAEAALGRAQRRMQALSRIENT